MRTVCSFESAGGMGAVYKDPRADEEYSKLIAVKIV